MVIPGEGQGSATLVALAQAVTQVYIQVLIKPDALGLLVTIFSSAEACGMK